MAAVKERPERTAQGYPRFRCLDCAKQFNERSSGLLNRTQYPSDVIAPVVFWRLRYKLSLRDLAEMFLTPARHTCERGIRPIRDLSNSFCQLHANKPAADQAEPKRFRCEPLSNFGLKSCTSSLNTNIQRPTCLALP